MADITLSQIAAQFEALVWGPWLVVLLIGGGLFFLIYSSGLPYRHIPHAIGLVLSGDKSSQGTGELTHAQALAAALAGTMGLGNIAGVALAIAAGGPGAVFWMWMSALVGVATKFFTCTLGVMYRGEDSLGRVQGGPMYVIREALPRQFYPLAILFALAGLVGTLPMFQANQLSALAVDTLYAGDAPIWVKPAVGLSLSLLVAAVIFGGLRRVALVAEAVLPTMVVVYMSMTAWVLFRHYADIPAMLVLIVSDAFTAKAAGGGVLGVVLVGVSRGAFSNEAGVGTEVMAHGAARTNEPVREGLVAMLGPIVDTLLVCTCTAVVILLTGNWQNPGELSGITLTAQAFRAEMGWLGPIGLGFVTLVLSTTTMFTTWYYGAKCFGFLFGAHVQQHFRWFFLVNVIFGASVSVDVVFSLISGSYGLMAIPTMVSTLLLAPKVMSAARDYFARYDASQ